MVRQDTYLRSEKLQRMRKKARRSQNAAEKARLMNKVAQIEQLYAEKAMLMDKVHEIQQKKEGYERKISRIDGKVLRIYQH